MKTVVLALFVFGTAVGAYASSLHHGSQFSDFCPEMTTTPVAIRLFTAVAKC